MPSYASLRDEKPKQFDEMVSFIASLKAENEGAEPSGGAAESK